MKEKIHFRNRMKPVHLAVISTGLFVLVGCSSIGLEEKRVDYKSAATARVPSLEVPPDLTKPGAEDQYAIPEGGETSASYSDFAKGSGGQLQPKAATVLPQQKNAHIERNGALRWLVVDDKAENLWPQIKAFWQENGFTIKTENMQAGVLETDWAENRAKIPQGGLRSLIGKVFDNLYSSGEQDMYRTRLERSKDGNSTEIYVSHYGKEEVLSADQSTTKWQSRPNDPGLEATMLQLLMAKLGGSADAAAPSAQGAAAEKASADSGVAAPKLQAQPKGGKTILLSEPFDKSWRQVGLALDRARFVVEDKDRANGVFFVRVNEPTKDKGLLSKLAFWRSAESKPVRYQVTVRENSLGVEVAANSMEGENVAEVQRIIEELFKQLSAR